MTNEVLQKAYIIKREIEGLEEHKEKLNNMLKKEDLYFSIGYGYNYDANYTFIDDFLPKDFNKFIMDYIIKIDKKISELEQEFKNL